MKKHKQTKLTSKLAIQLLSLDLDCIKQKLATGKPLSPNERAYLQAAAAADSPKLANPKATQAGLAKALGISKQCLNAHIGKPGAPQDLSDIEGWRSYLLATGKFPTIQKLQAGAGGLITAMPKSNNKLLVERARNLHLQNLKLAAQLAKDKKEWIPVALAEQIAAKFVGSFKATLLNSSTRIATLARMADGTATAANLVREEFCSILRMMANGHWFDDQKSQSANDEADALLAEKSSTVDSEALSHA